MRAFIKRNKKTLISVLVLIAVALLTLNGVFNGHDPKEVIESVKRVAPEYILRAVFCVLLFICMQGFIIYIMLKASRQKAVLGHCMLLAFSGYFFCSITPFAIGGPSMQLYYMKKDGIAVPVSAAIILIFTFMYKVVLVFVGFGILIFGQDMLWGELRGIHVWYGVGLFLTAGFCFMIGFFVFRSDLARRFFVWGVKKLEEKHILKHKEGRVEKVRAGMERYEITADYFLDHKLLSLLVFLLSCVQRFILFSVTYYVYTGLGGTQYGLWEIALLQSVVSLCVDLLPIPGGMGVSELIFMSIFTGVFLPGTEITGLALSRGISYYVQLIVCAVVAIFAHFFFTRMKEKKSGK